MMHALRLDRACSSMHASTSGRQPHWHQQQPMHLTPRRPVPHSPPQCTAVALHDAPSPTNDLKTHHRSLMRLANRSIANLPTALAQLDDLLQSHPTNAHLLVSRGVLCSRMGHTDDAEAAFTAASNYAPEDGAVYQVPRAPITPAFPHTQQQAWGYHRAQQGDAHGAVQLFERAATLPGGFQPSALHAWAQVAQQQGNIDRAKALYQQALEVDPRHVASLQALGCIEASARRFKAARQLFTAATTANSGHGPSWVAWALMEARRGRRQQALALFKRGNVAAPGHVPLLSAWARLEHMRMGNGAAHCLYKRAPQAKMGRSESAVKLFTSALDIDPVHMQSLQGLAALRALGGAHEEARELYERGLRVQPHNAHLLHGMAQLYAQQLGDVAGALQLLQQILETHPNHARAHYSMGQLLQGEGRFEEARACYEAGMGGGPDNASTEKQGGRQERNKTDYGDRLRNRIGLAELEAFFGNAGRARALYTAADGPNVTAPYLRAWAMFEKRQGRLDEAVKLYARCTALDPHDWNVWLHWGLTERRRQRYAAASNAFKRAAAIAPHQASVWQAWAKSEAEAGNYASARQVYSQGAAAVPDTPALLLDWALLEAEMGEHATARALFTSGANITPVHVPLLQAWAGMERDGGRRSEAARIEGMLEELKADNVGDV